MNSPCITNLGKGLKWDRASCFFSPLLHGPFQKIRGPLSEEKLLKIARCFPFPFLLNIARRAIYISEVWQRHMKAWFFARKGLADGGQSACGLGGCSEKGRHLYPVFPTATRDLIPTISQLVPDDHVYSLGCIISCWNETHQLRSVPELRFHNKSRDSCSCNRPLLDCTTHVRSIQLRNTTLAKLVRS